MNLLFTWTHTKSLINSEIKIETLWKHIFSVTDKWRYGGVMQRTLAPGLRQSVFKSWLYDLLAIWQSSPYFEGLFWKLRLIYSNTKLTSFHMGGCLWEIFLPENLILFWVSVCVCMCLCDHTIVYCLFSQSFPKI